MLRIAADVREALFARVDGDAVLLGHADDLRVEGETKHGEQVDAVVFDGLLGGLLDEGRADGPVLRSDRDADPSRCVAILGHSSSLADSLNVPAGIGLERSELIRSLRLPFWIPATTRLSRIDRSKFGPSASLAAPVSLSDSW